MARSLIGGLVATGMSNKDISVSEPKADLREKLSKNFGVNALEENGLLVNKRIPIKSKATKYNRDYLKTKAKKLGHLL